MQIIAFLLSSVSLLFKESEGGGGRGEGEEGGGHFFDIMAKGIGTYLGEGCLSEQGRLYSIYRNIVFI